MPSKLVLLSWDDAAWPPLGIGGGPATPPAYPGHGLPGGGGHPGHDLPGGGGHPSTGLPPAHIGGGPIYLPVFPFDPTKPVEPDAPPRPDAGPVPIAPGGRFVVKWLACHGLILVPDNALPPAPAPK